MENGSDAQKGLGGETKTGGTQGKRLSINFGKGSKPKVGRQDSTVNRGDSGSKLVKRLGKKRDDML